MASVLRSPSPPSVPPVEPGPRRPAEWPGRWIAIGLVSVLLHLTALDLLPRWSLDAGDAAPDLPLTVTLLQPVVQPPAPVAVAAVAPDPPRKVVRTRPAPVREPAFVPESYEPAVAVTVHASPAASTDRPGVAAGPPPAPQPAPAPLPEPAAPTSPSIPPPPPPQAVAPRSAKLYYKLEYVDAKSINPVHYYGVGTIDWVLADGRYRSDLVASYKALLVKVDLLVLHSEGTVTDAGLAPDRYTESKGRRATVATNFNRDARQSITFSAASTSVPLPPGAQDRLSLLFQIGGLLMADPAEARPASRVTLPVAGVRGDVESWVFDIVGVETIEAGGDPLSTLHLRRAPRSDSRDQTIDVWIAQVAGGYPAKVLYTEANGSTTELTLDRIGRGD